MTAPRKTTSLLAWMPAQGTPGQRHARAALARAFADVAALPENRTGRVRAALAEIAQRASDAYAARTSDADEPASEPAPKASKPKASKASESKPKPDATGKVAQQYCKACKVPTRNLVAHKRGNAHKRAVAANRAADTR